MRRGAAFLLWVTRPRLGYLAVSDLLLLALTVWVVLSSLAQPSLLSLALSFALGAAAGKTGACLRRAVIYRYGGGR